MAFHFDVLQRQNLRRGLKHGNHGNRRGRSVGRGEGDQQRAGNERGRRHFSKKTHQKHILPRFSPLFYFYHLPLDLTPPLISYRLTASRPASFFTSGSITSFWRHNFLTQNLHLSPVKPMFYNSSKHLDEFSQKDAVVILFPIFHRNTWQLID